MSTVAPSQKKLVTSSLDRPRRLSWTAVALSGVIAVLYSALFVIVRGVETGPRAAEVMDSTYGAYLFLTIAYVVSAIAYAVLDRRGVWLAGAVLQVVVIALFFMFGVGVLDYDLVVETTPIGVWAGVITGLEVVLLGVLGYLATLKPAGRHAA